MLSSVPAVLFVCSSLEPGRDGVGDYTRPLGITSQRQGANVRAVAQICWVCLGEIPPQGVSRYLQEFDFGIAATLWELVSKSGSAAAMLDHGLPVVVPRNDFHSRAPSVGNPAGSQLLVQASEHKKWTQGGWLSLRQHPVDRSSVVAEKLLSHLIASSR